MKYAIATLFIITAIASPAHASDVQQKEDGNAASICHPAMPVYDAHIRKRPLAVVNEGDFDGYVTCAFRAPTNSYGQESFGLVLRNQSTSPKTVTCTAVIGVDDGAARHRIKDTTLAAGQRKLVSWTYQADNGGDRIQTNTSVSCRLPPLTGINEAPQTFRQR